MLLYLALKNIVSKKSSFVIIFFISFAVMLFVVTNSVFDSTEKGIQQTFVSGFTGDIVIRPLYKAPLSLFGDETPVTGKHTELPALIPYDDIYSYLESLNKFSHLIPQVTSLAAVDLPSGKSPVFLFGVDASSYLNAMSSIKILEGKAFEKGQKGVMLSKKVSEKFNLKTGDNSQFIVQEGFSSKIRSAPVTALYEYKIDNPVMDRIVLSNPELVRELTGMNEYSSQGDIVLSERVEELLGDFDMDSLFEEAEDFEKIRESEDEDTVTVRENKDQALFEDEQSIHSSSWNFLILKASNPAKTSSLIKKLNRDFRERQWPVQAVNWRSSAGNTAFYLYILRLILNAGIIIVLAAGFIVVNNTLVINVLDRIREIGTMRAIGAEKLYIIKECASETMIMSFTAGIAGCIFGAAFSSFLSALNITFTNSFLIQLFGGETLKTSLTFSNLLTSFCLSLFLGMIAWIYPVINALKVNPVEAMQGAK
jgi:ABC-type lipoprotein release transport system permease subunit